LHRRLLDARRPDLRCPRPTDPPDLMSERLLEVKGLKVHFATEDGVVHAVDGVDFTLDRGDVLGIVGESGSGKSVTAMTLLGLTRQRAMIAIALSCNPDVLVADEPTTALDVTIQAQILELVSQLKDDFDSAVIMITHDLGVVADLADEIAVMYAGRVVEHGKK